MNKLIWYQTFHVTHNRVLCLYRKIFCHAKKYVLKKSIKKYFGLNYLILLHVSKKGAQKMNDGKEAIIYT